ncbi:MAG: MOSC domain-containing protein [Sphingomonadaceae bacterium]|nr:MAG: MOSC domain-containing protein [Sphingomonadaceae bacterium]
MRVIIAALCAGAGKPLPNGKRSGIAKAAIPGAVKITENGIEADEQVDRVHHGYPEMALHHLPHETYDWLRHHFGPLPRLGDYGSMGENIATLGLSEHEVWIGDRFRLGSALVEITQPRQPCSTIEQHLQSRGIVKSLVAAARTGWFYRVLEPGQAGAGDQLELVERGHVQWSIARAFLITYGAARGPDRELDELAKLPRISDRLVRDIEKRLANQSG